MKALLFLVRMLFGLLVLRGSVGSFFTRLGILRNQPLPFGFELLHDVPCLLTLGIKPGFLTFQSGITIRYSGGGLLLGGLLPGVMSILEITKFALMVFPSIP